MQPAATAMSLFMWKRYHAYWPGTATGRGLQLSGDILQTVLPDVAWHNNIRAERGASWQSTA